MINGCRWQQKKFSVSMSPSKKATMVWVPAADKKRENREVKQNDKKV